MNVVADPAATAWSRLRRFGDTGLSFFMGSPPGK
jgi:hypothetical protein